ncbi:4Fe-4S ferredoxin, iron-sulfur binding protein [Syntrophobotulus glycolicus DSM 8271]|uniref:4Fe-4S ferredoxin, iron-sulfur binding protein n=1 Tax=Syntrophobotulus glycolicus (strain DSM 8271 / FlGlyR) TaxID=645991 RepID=F0T0Q5_SYNGF|nr:4Fe-4S dicluster domain-containing protein [Syntrophobotulus glycolicus]ADY56194.1 4Fe-4S ferredoxin, iron-sulfur binding protein [Syntrophobotulus glycolicus DSM 8271]
MEQLTMEVRKIARELLEKGEVNTVIGWEQGNFWYATTPVFIDKPEDTDRLVWNEYCASNLSKYLLDFKDTDGKIAIFVKGCDARGVNRLIQDKQISRDKVVLLGLSCPGMKDDKLAQGSEQGADIPEAVKCRSCRFPDPVIYDRMIGEKQNKKLPEGKDYSDVQAVEGLTADEKYQKFTANYAKCVRCYACRNVCPACNCRDCIFDHSEKGWLGKTNSVSENLFFALTRAMHVAGRCIDCGECERVCPSNVPIMLVNKKLAQDIDNLFGDYEAGVDLDKKLPLGGYEYSDPEEFM